MGMKLRDICVLVVAIACASVILLPPRLPVGGRKVVSRRIVDVEARASSRALTPSASVVARR
jgi:hypothetical protein